MNNKIRITAIILTVIGAIGFTLDGFLNVDFITQLFGNRTIGGDFFRILIGLASILVVISEFIKKES